MKNKFNLVIQTPEKSVFAGEVESLSVRLDGGHEVIYAHHASMVGTVSFGSAVVGSGDNGEETDKFLVRQGFLSFDNATNTCRLAAYYCELETEVSEADAKDYLAFVEAELAKGASLSDFQIEYLEGEKIAVTKQLAGK